MKALKDKVWGNLPENKCKRKEEGQIKISPRHPTLNWSERERKHKGKKNE